MSAQIHVGDIGTVFEANFVDEDGDAVSLATATVKQLIFRKPGGSTVVQEGTTTATVGQLEYAAVEGDLDQAGQWRVQGYAEFASGEKYHADITIFDVQRNLD
jgi:hypothetical protein